MVYVREYQRLVKELQRLVFRHPLCLEDISSMNRILCYVGQGLSPFVK